MTRAILLLPAASLALAMASCISIQRQGHPADLEFDAAGDDISVDGSTGDGGDDDGGASEVDTPRDGTDSEDSTPGPGALAPSHASLTNGGGTGASESYYLNVSVGTPQPHGAGQSETVRIKLGPLAQSL